MGNIDLKQFATIRKLESEMHTNSALWIYRHGKESEINPDKEYKVWVELRESDDPQHAFEYVVYYYEEVPEEILEAEMLVENYRSSKEPFKN